MRNDLYLNGLIYIGEWHKHPGLFDQPSAIDLQMMKGITSDDLTKDVITAISVVQKVPGAGKMVKIKFFYYKKGMASFIQIEPHIVSLPQLRSKPKKVKNAFLEIGNILDLMKKPKKPMIINGKLNENLSALFINSDNISTNITARLILNQKDGNEISLHAM